MCDATSTCSTHHRRAGVGSYESAPALDFLIHQKAQSVGPSANFVPGPARLPVEKGSHVAVPGPGTYQPTNDWIKKNHRWGERQEAPPRGDGERGRETEGGIDYDRVAAPTTSPPLLLQVPSAGSQAAHLLHARPLRALNPHGATGARGYANPPSPFSFLFVCLHCLIRPLLPTHLVPRATGTRRATRGRS